jgi:hypothetical protein
MPEVSMVAEVTVAPSAFHCASLPQLSSARSATDATAKIRRSFFIVLLSAVYMVDFKRLLSIGVARRRPGAGSPKTRSHRTALFNSLVFNKFHN